MEDFIEHVYCDCCGADITYTIRIHIDDDFVVCYDCSTLESTDEDK